MDSLPGGIIEVLRHFEPAFSGRVWRHVTVLVVGAILAPGRRTVASMSRDTSRTSGSGRTWWLWTTPRPDGRLRARGTDRSIGQCRCRPAGSSTRAHRTGLDINAQSSDSSKNSIRPRGTSMTSVTGPSFVGANPNSSLRIPLGRSRPSSPE